MLIDYDYNATCKCLFLLTLALQILLSKLSWYCDLLPKAQTEDNATLKLIYPTSSLSSVSLSYFSRSSGLAKTILKGTVRGAKRSVTVRQRKQWEDNARGWTWLGVPESPWAVEYWQRWRQLIKRSSVVPQWPSGSRDRLIKSKRERE